MTVCVQDGCSLCLTLLHSFIIKVPNEKEFYDTTRKYRRASMRAIIFSAVFGPVMFLVAYICVALTLTFGGSMVINGVLEISVLYLFIDYIIRFFDPVMMLSSSLAEFQQAQAAEERVVSLIETEPEIKDTDLYITETSIENSEIKLTIEDGQIYINNVLFKLTDFVDLGDSYNNGPKKDDNGVDLKLIRSKIVLNTPKRVALRLDLESSRDIVQLIISLDKNTNYFKFDFK